MSERRPSAAGAHTRQADGVELLRWRQLGVHGLRWRSRATERGGIRREPTEGRSEEDPRAMSAQRMHEMEFELALTSRLEDQYGLRVRAEHDPLNRRQSGYTTLCFAYRYAGAESARVRVAIDGCREASFRFDLDLSDVDQVEAVTSECEDLARAIEEVHRSRRVERAPADRPRRREDD